VSFAEKFASQALSGPVLRDPSAVAERLLAVQGQDPRGVRLAVRARTEGLCARDVDGALTEERSLVISWLNRGTLHLVRSEDYRWLHAMTTPPLEASAKRRLAHEGIAGAEGERAVAAIDRYSSIERGLRGPHCPRPGGWFSVRCFGCWRRARRWSL